MGTKVINLDETPVEIIAESIKAIADGVRKLRAGPLTDRALFLLIQHSAPMVRGRYIGISEIKRVFDGISSLEGEYLKKKVKP
ncbi:MAG TPA: hypothetical protein VJS69_14215 [Candidatus Krumholzibacteria bacterium]|nr:hypothetical protein [Candidatus Krumholzibacteria bacterium]